MKVLISGSSGLVGSELVAHLEAEGDEVHRLVRRISRAERTVAWDPAEPSVDGDALEGFDAVVHLAGESIAEGRWTEDKMRRIRDSRVQGTRFLCERLAERDRPPAVLVCASAIGFYGDRAGEVMGERSSGGSTFLADVCREWEDACEPAHSVGIRVVNLRIGIVLSRAGGALAKMLLPFQLGVGGKLGSGEQWMSWIELGDVVGAIQHALSHERLSGPVNAVSPYPVTNAVFTSTLGRVLSRPTLLPMPAFAARLAFGHMADELLLASTRVEPRALADSGFEFQFPQLEAALRHAVGRGTKHSPESSARVGAGVGDA